ncbi:sugar MFS transporter [Pseudocolwellia sp. HL-MZ19]|uniref:sugar MFS transporter n=1 Tax=Pseudocolwellia sp. HL-MZ19 TaxID=3400846 RepID=UPI003CE99CFC
MQTLTTHQEKHRTFLPMLIIGILFFVFGFVTWLNGALIPFLQIVCDLSEIEAIFVASAFYIAFVLMALPMAWVLDKTGYKHAMVLGLIIMAVGSLLFIPAAYSKEFSIFLIAQFIVGTGLTILQTASNPYIVKIGPKETAAVRISIMGLLNKGAGFVAPIVFTALVLGDLSGVSAKSIAALPELERFAKIDQLASGLVQPYIGLAIALAVLAFSLKLSALPELNLESEQEADNDSKSVFQFPQLILGVITLFFYVGVEVIAGDTIGLFGSQLGVANATSLTSYTMAFMVVGYLAGLAFIPRFINQSQALLCSSILGIILCLSVVYSSHDNTAISSIFWGWSGLPLLPNTVAFVALLGFANALVWPAVWPLALDGLGKHTAKASALLIMGIAGGAVIPVIYGQISEYLGPQDAYWLLIPCYLFILFYALKGHKIRKWG